MGIYGYTPNLALRDFVDVNGVTGRPVLHHHPDRGGVRPRPTLFWMFPNGSNAKGDHYYYDEWAASAHSYRAALAETDPDAMAYQASGKGTTRATCSAPTPSPPAATSATPARGICRPRASAWPRASRRLPTTSARWSRVPAVPRRPSLRHRCGGRRARPGQGRPAQRQGLSVDNASICEDCHNWQTEVLGQTPNHGAHHRPRRPWQPQPPAARDAARTSAMFEVANGGEFMPGVKCEDCHMPKTNKAETRISHGMKPMLPGDAELWQRRPVTRYG